MARRLRLSAHPERILAASVLAFALAGCGGRDSETAANTTATPATAAQAAGPTATGPSVAEHPPELDAAALHQTLSGDARRVHDEMMEQREQALGGQAGGGANNPTAHSALLDAQAMHEAMSADQRRMHDEMMQMRQQPMPQGGSMPMGNAMPMQDHMDMPMNKGGMPGMAGSTPPAKADPAPAPMQMKDHM